MLSSDGFVEEENASRRESMSSIISAYAENSEDREDGNLAERCYSTRPGSTSTPSQLAKRVVHFADADDSMPIRPTARSASVPHAQQHRSASTGVLTRAPRARSSTKQTSRSTAALAVAPGKLVTASSPRIPMVGTKTRSKTEKNEEEHSAQKQTALSRVQASYDAVVRYCGQLVLSESSVLAIIARVLKLRFRAQQALLSEGQFVVASSLCAAYGLMNIKVMERRLALRKRLVAVQVSMLSFDSTSRRLTRWPD